MPRNLIKVSHCITSKDVGIHIHYIRVKYGILDAGYSKWILSILFGPGQDATLGPFLWLFYFILIVLCIHLDIPWFHCTVLDNPVVVSHWGESFIDDMCLGCSLVTPDSSNSQRELFAPPRFLKFSMRIIWVQTIQHPLKLAILFSTKMGTVTLHYWRCLKFVKSFWFSFSWSWK
jgi:hypothetical protein